ATLLICLLTLKMLDMKKLPLTIRVLATIAGVVLLEWIPFDYGAYALVLMLIYRYLSSTAMITIHFIAEIIFMVYNSWLVQFFSMIITYVIAFKPNIIQLISQWRTPSWLWRSFYPLHLAILAFINYYIHLLD
ncbi:MAG TPA: conjugal transfer protein TraX, partial [Candidatus Paenibacillus intestinavium]|nr:conjugal transfer protein TraX [Candidatus Paenibacillus intestinavium]